MKVSLLTLGCRVNQSESAIIEGSLKENGATIVDLKNSPDYCVVNTCTVTGKSDYNSRQLIRRAAKAGAKVIVTGCYSQLESERVRSIPGVIAVIDNRKKYEIITLISGRPLDPSFGNYGRSRPHLKVQDGCNFNCSYCAVPMARGRSRSLSLNDAVNRAQLIESRGFREIVLTGVHLGSYGRDLPEKTNLATLVRLLLTNTRLVRIRLSSLEINELDDEMMELLSEERICRHLHLPLQSGSSRILRLMRRNYDIDLYGSRVNAVASRVSNIAIGSDIIVGFPGEREQDFRDTCGIVKDLPFSYLHVFPFSVRPGTDASLMTDRPDTSTVKGRLHELNHLTRAKRMEYLEVQLYKELEVIVEERLGSDTFRGTSGNYLKVTASGHSEKGSVVRVRPEEICQGVLKGVVISTS